MNIETIGKIAASGFGDRVFIGFLLSYLGIETDYQCYESIRNNRQPLDKVTETEWEMWRKLAKKVKPEDITTKKLFTEMQNRRPELLQVVINHPNGRKWLDSQMVIVRQKLGLE